MLGIPLQIFSVAAVMESQGTEEAQIVAVDFTGSVVAIQGINTAIFHDVVREADFDLSLSDGLVAW